MQLRMIMLTALAVGMFSLAGGPATGQEKKELKPEEVSKIKKALGEVQDFVGLWNLEVTQKEDGKVVAWKEKLSWGWNFKGEPSLTADFNEGKGKLFTSGVLRYDLTKKKYQLVLKTANKTEEVYEGVVPPTGGLKLERKDAKTGDAYRVALGTLADGIRFQVKFEKQDGGKGLFNNVFAMNGNKDGESFAGGAKKPECIVSGGAANMSVSYNGKTYFVCCTGCRDEFNANPKKYAK